MREKSVLPNRVTLAAKPLQDRPHVQEQLTGIREATVANKARLLQKNKTAELIVLRPRVWSPTVDVENSAMEGAAILNWEVTRPWPNHPVFSWFCCEDNKIMRWCLKRGNKSNENLLYRRHIFNRDSFCSAALRGGGNNLLSSLHNTGLHFTISQWLLNWCWEVIST